MNDFTVKHLALSILVALAAGCGHDAPETRINVALGYEDGLRLDTVDVTLSSGTETAPIAHELRLIIPDELAGTELPIEVWGRMAGKRAAYGLTSAIPKLDDTVQAALTLHACAPGCEGDQLTTCSGPALTCGLGCSQDGDAHCVAPRPSNGVDPTLADSVLGTTTISTDTTFDVDTGAIIGGLERAAGVGVVGGVGYFQAPVFAGGGAPLGIFVFHDLTIAATVHVTGTRAAVVLVGGDANIASEIDVAAGPVTPGPGGGAGGTATAAAGGCGAGGPGISAETDTKDSGGGGGGAGTQGAVGGFGSGILAGGAAGIACLSTTLEPLQGGSGGGIGSPGSAAAPARGGGGGGALQITALGSLTITGTINAGGAGGEGGPPAPAGTSTKGAGAGAGGGAGGAILLESPTVTIGSAAIIAANGGAGGGGGNNTIAGTAGDSAHASRAVAVGGAGALIAAAGGDGGATTILPMAGGGSSATSNGGGGGGAVGAIVIRGRVRTVDGIVTPTPSLLDVQVP